MPTSRHGVDREPGGRGRVWDRMQRAIQPTAIAVVLSLTVIGCDGPADPETAGTLRGEVVAGPTCPVVREPPDPACDDRAVPGAVVAIEAADGGEVARLEADAAGEFVVTLQAGVYTLIPQSVPGLMGTAAPQEVEIQAGGNVAVVVIYDTGIR